MNASDFIQLRIDTLRLKKEIVEQDAFKNDQQVPQAPIAEIVHRIDELQLLDATLNAYGLNNEPEETRSWGMVKKNLMHNL